MTFEQTLKSNPLLLMECAIIERLRRSQPELLHPRLIIAPLIQTGKGRTALTTLYREYIRIAEKADLPLILNTPTWRTSRDRCAAENIKTDLNSDAVEFMLGFKKEYPNLFIGGQLGCRNDCYKPEEALSRKEAADFHSWQIERLTTADFLYGVTLPEINEALGMAQAMAETDRPYIISFAIGQDGNLLDGTPLNKVIEIIDSETKRRPIGYGVNCCYPSFLQTAKLNTSATERMISIQANASSLTHAELEKAETVQNDPIDDWADRMLSLHQTLQLKFLGGCCGTTADHMKWLVKSL